MNRGLWKNFTSRWEELLSRWRPKLPLIKKKEFFEVSLQSIGDGVIIVDEKGKIIFFNHAAENLTGWVHSEVLGKPLDRVFKIIDKAKGEPIENPYLSVIHSKKVVGLKNNTVLIAKNGDERYISASSAPIMEKNTVIAGVVVVFRDITRIKQAEEELQKTKEAAEAANRAKSDFLANMSHEIRTPLNGIIGMTDLTLLTDLTPGQIECLTIVKSSAQTLLKVINDILDYSKIEAGKMTLERIDFEVRDLMNQIIRFHSVSAAEKGLKLFAEVSPEVPQVLTGDPVRLQQVLNNLIGNAVKFTEQGVISVHLKRNTCVDPRARDRILLQFSISDTGIGIAEDKLGYLFKSFSQVDGSITRRYGGTGLGLAISKKIVELMEGSIWVESRPGVGSTFYFTALFDRGVDSDTNFSGFDHNSPSQLSKVANPLRILVVDDDQTNRTVLLQMLEKRGHWAEAVNNGWDALKALEQKDFDLVLMDIQMPDLDGVETLRFIRQNGEKGRISKIPVIAVTARALQGDREKYLAAGMDGYVSKPVQMEKLFAEIERLFPLAKSGELSPKNLTAAEVLKSINSLEQVDPGCRTKSLSQFNIESMALFNGMKTALDSNNMALLERLAHSLKTLAAGMGAAAIKNLAFKMQLAARRKHSDGALDLYQKLVDEVQRLEQE
ncbi:MAG: response regulator [Firmicutes bacterium]|nr:response regulator [Bacillota bacterium]